MKKKLCFIMDEFLYGGIERILLNYVSAIDQSKYEVDVVVLARCEDMIQQIPDYCHVIRKKLPRSHCPLSRSGAMVSRPAGAVPYYATYLLKKIILEPIDRIRFREESRKKYDVVIAFSGHMNDMHAALKIFRGKKKLVWAHGVIYQYLLMSPAFEKMYRKFDKIVCINHIDQSDIFYCKPYLKYQIESLYNPIMLKDDSTSEEELEELRQKYDSYILTVARLDYPKDFDTLLQAYAILKERYHLGYNLVIVGDGPDRPKVEALIKKLGLEKSVFLTGSQDNVGKYYRCASLFAFSSLAEGLPTVIIEAMKYGLPVVSTESRYGAMDIIRGNQYGILTPVRDAEAMASEIHKMLTDGNVYERYQLKSLERYQDFLPDRIMEQFYKIIES